MTFNKLIALAQFKAVFKLFLHPIFKCGKSSWAGDGGLVILATHNLDAGEAIARPSHPSPGCGNWEIWVDPVLEKVDGLRPRG